MINKNAMTITHLVPCASRTPICNNDILEFLLSTTQHTLLVIRSINPSVTDERVERVMMRRNINHSSYPSDEFHFDTNIESGKVNIIVVLADLQGAFKATESVRVKTVLITEEQCPKSIEDCVANTWRKKDTVMITEDELISNWTDLSPECKINLKSKCISFQGCTIKFEDFESILVKCKGSETFLMKLVNSNDHLSILNYVPTSPLPQHYVTRKFSTTPINETADNSTISIMTGQKDVFVTSLVNVRKDSDYEDLLSEDQLISNANTDISIQTSVSGTGLTCFMSSLCLKLKKKWPTRLVIHLKIQQLIEMMSDFVETLEEMEEEDSDDYDEMEDLLDSAFNTFVTHNALLGVPEAHADLSRTVIKYMMTNASGDEQNLPNCELMLTDWADLSSFQVPTALDLVKHLKKYWKGTRVWTFTAESQQPCSFYRGLEESLEGYTSFYMTTLSYADQLQIVQTFTNGNEGIINSVKTCLESLSEALDDYDFHFTSFPRHLLLLVELCTELFSPENSFDYLGPELEQGVKCSPPGIVLFLELCARIMKQQSQKEKLDIEMFNQIHTFYGLKKLLPGSKHFRSPEIKKMSTNDIRTFGIISNFTKASRGKILEARFILPVFAEYFTWMFIVQQNLFEDEIVLQLQEKKCPLLDKLLEIRQSKQDQLLVDYLSNSGTCLKCFKLSCGTLENKIMGGTSVLSSDTLMGAITSGNFPIVKYLMLEKGLGPVFWNMSGGLKQYLECAVKSAVSASSEQMMEDRKQILCLFTYLNKGQAEECLQNMFSKDWVSVLDASVHISMIDLCLAECGIELDKTDQFGRTPLHAVALRQNAEPEIDVSGFINRAVNGNVQWKQGDNDGNNAVDLAFKQGQASVALMIGEALAEGTDEMMEDAKVILGKWQDAAVEQDLQASKPAALALKNKLNIWEQTRTSETVEMRSHKSSETDWDGKKKKKKSKWCRPFCCLASYL